MSGGGGGKAWVDFHTGLLRVQLEVPRELEPLFVRHNLDVLVNFWYCGYVALPKGHPLWGKNYKELWRRHARCGRRGLLDRGIRHGQLGSPHGKGEKFTQQKARAETERLARLLSDRR